MDNDEEYSSYEEDGEEDGDEEYENEEDDEEDEQYSSDEEEKEKVIDRELEWDDTSIEIKDKRIQKANILSNSKHLSNKSLVGNDFNNFV